MLSFRNLVLYVALCASCLHLSSAAPRAACSVSTIVTTIFVTINPHPHPLTNANDVIAASAEPAAPSSTLPVDPAATPEAVPSDTVATDSSTTPAADPSPTLEADLSATPAADPTISGSTTPTLPTNGGGTELPSPTAALKFVTIGRGVQNYTCSAVGAVPVALGAVATLFDFTSLASTSATSLDAVPPTIVNTALSSVSGSSSLTVDGLGTFPFIGTHFFGADGTPIFNLTTAGDILFCKKIASVNAPAGASDGPDGTGAVPWLNLADKGGSVGLVEVYRVVTAGGKAPAACADTNLISVQYAAEYWFFG